jgi:hypothetical protein
MKTRILVLVCLGGVGRAGAGDTTFLPDVSVDLRAARYVPSDPDFQWTGWIGAGAGLVRSHGATLYFTADLETIVGNMKRTFDPNEANYHLEAGVDRPFGDKGVNLFFHHVSRHLIDRPKDATVDWNVLGARASAPLPAPFPLKLTLGVGHTTRASLIAYGFEVTGRLEADLVRPQWGTVYVDSYARLVTTEASPIYPRGHFVDLLEEGGIRWTREGRILELFAAYQHRNDVFLLVPATRDWLLLGFHIGFGPSRGLWYPQ